MPDRAVPPRRHFTVTGICFEQHEAVSYWTIAPTPAAARTKVAERAPECDELMGPVFRGWLKDASELAG
jgi:hypothetical protein